MDGAIPKDITMPLAMELVKEIWEEARAGRDVISNHGQESLFISGRSRVRHQYCVPVESALRNWKLCGI